MKFFLAMNNCIITTVLISKYVIEEFSFTYVLKTVVINSKIFYKLNLINCIVIIGALLCTQQNGHT